MPKKTLAYTRYSVLNGEAHLLQCGICGENDRRKLLVENMGLCVSGGGDDYCFCKKCWNSPNLGKKLLKLLGFEKEMKLSDECLDIKEIE